MLVSSGNSGITVSVCEISTLDQIVVKQFGTDSGNRNVLMQY